MGLSTRKKIAFVRTRAVTHGDLANLLEMLGEGVSPLHKRESGQYGNGGIAFTTKEPKHQTKYVKFTGADLPDTFTPGSDVVWGDYTEPVWTPSNRFHIEVFALGMNFGDTSGLCAAIKAALGCMDLRDVKALERAVRSGTRGGGRRGRHVWGGPKHPRGGGGAAEQAGQEEAIARAAL